MNHQDQIRGCIVGGAAGDALGYAIEFKDEDEIFSRYGEAGITAYEPDKNGKALISDDTQMALFTAAVQEERRRCDTLKGLYRDGSLLRWLTQLKKIDDSREK